MSESKHLRRPSQASQLAKLMTEIASGKREDLVTDDGRDLAAVIMGRRGGLKGGRARAERLTPEQRSNIARLAAAARWKNK